MDFNFIQVLLVAVWAFICGIDQFSLTEALYRPLVSCTVIGFILGDWETGLKVGGAFELITIGQMPIGGAQPPNPVVGGVMAAVFALGSGLDTNQAVALAIPFALLGQFMVTLVFTGMSGFMALSDKYAAEANPKGITAINWGAMAILGGLFAIVALLGLFMGQAAGPKIDAFLTNYAWLSNGLGVAGGMMRFVGFGILLKVMMAKDLWAYYFTGFAAANIVGATSVASSAVLMLAIVGVTIALFDYQTNVKFKNAGSSVSGGDEEDGI